MRTADLWRKGDDGGEESAVAGPSLGAASGEICRLQLTVWEQWL